MSGKQTARRPVTPEVAGSSPVGPARLPPFLAEGHGSPHRFGGAMNLMTCLSFCR